MGSFSKAEAIQTFTNYMTVAAWNEFVINLPANKELADYPQHIEPLMLHK